MVSIASICDNGVAKFWGWQMENGPLVSALDSLRSDFCRAGQPSSHNAPAERSTPRICRFMGYKTELRNGTTVDSQRIKTFYDSWLKPLYNQDPNLAAQLFFFAQNDEYVLPEENAAWFVKTGFLEPDGTLDPDFRNVILSAVSVNYETSVLSIERPERPKTPAK